MFWWCTRFPSCRLGVELLGGHSSRLFFLSRLLAVLSSSSNGAREYKEEYNCKVKVSFYQLYKWLSIPSRLVTVGSLVAGSCLITIKQWPSCLLQINGILTHL